VRQEGGVVRAGMGAQRRGAWRRHDTHLFSIADAKGTHGPAGQEADAARAAPKVGSRRELMPIGAEQQRVGVE